MLNKVLYAIFRTPANVRLAKGAIATGITAGLGALLQSLVEGGWEIPVIVISVGTPIVLWIEKRVQAWGQSS